MFGYPDLNDDERLALVSLLRLVVQADKQYSREEDSRLAQISSEMGDDLYDGTVTEARAKLPTPEDVRRHAAKVVRPESRAFILGLLQGIAAADGEATEEKVEIEALLRLWSL
jgi:uncharacterized tellurite resistance protein B-like protein